ncbi:MAG TPA: phospholipid carrier-dependent glycosyltransferase [Anaerolineae bacterium]|nr:phospholipid carrier-dependent glycosyltransferase [Anaerolineae bacterium]
MSEKARKRESGSADRRISGSPRHPVTPSPPLPLPISRLLLLLAFFALGMTQVRHASITFDEGPHLAIGYATLRTGDFRLQPIHIHPPLANMLAAAPLLLQADLPDPRAVDGWEIASLSAITDAVVWQYPHPARIAVAGRTPILLLGVLLGALICRWAKDLGGHRAGLLALALYAFDPNCIAHSALITTDVAAVLFIVATLYAISKSANQRVGGSADQRISESANPPSPPLPLSPSLLLVGILLGLAQLAKVSTLMLIPVVGLIILVDVLVKHSVLSPQSSVLKILLRASCIFLPAALVVWAGYGFQIIQVPGFPFPLPAGTHIRIFQSLYGHYDVGHPTFALGQISEHGWRWYFPLAFALKTPLPTIILLIVALVQSLKRIGGSANQRKSESTAHPITPSPCHLVSPSPLLPLLLFPLLYLLSSLFSTVNIGYRHLLPILPFLFIGIGQIANSEWRTANGEWRIANRVSRFTHYSLLITHYSLLTWLALSTCLTLPYPLTFFNELVGGAQNGYRYLVDSNLDWGQNLWDLQRWMADHGESHVFYAHYSPATPRVYDIDADFLPPDPRAVEFAPWNPAPGLYAIGATVLQGPYAPDLNTYAWFRSREPHARLGHALFVYRVPARPAPQWVALCNEAGVGVDVLPAHLGFTPPRVLALDCAQVEVYPADTPGVAIARADTALFAGTREAVLRDAAGHATVAVTRIETPPVLQDVVAVRFNGPLDFVGYNTQRGGQLWTYWRVHEIPSRPLSLMAHRLAPDGTTIVGDGLSFPIEQWRPGDLIVQRHDLDLPADGAATIQIGGYWLDTLERWRTLEGADAIQLAIENQ